jgi:chitodextrinase
VIASVAVAAVLAVVIGLLLWSPWSTRVASPTGLEAASTTATSVRLTWSPASGTTNVDGYLVQRSGTSVGSVSPPTNSFLDKGLTPGSTYRYTVVAVSGDARSEPSAAIVVTTPVPSPRGLVAVGRTVGSVNLRWSAPAADRAPDRYAIVRDGVTIGSVAGTALSYRDTGLRPATAYTYSVAALWGGHRSAPSSALVVRTITPPPSAARLQGSWGVRMKVVNAGGGSLSLGATLFSTWLFQPQCASGACNTRLGGDIGGDGYISHYFRMMLAKNGAVYTGTTQAHVTHCGGQNVRNTVTARIRVRQGSTNGADWVASRWNGTVTVSSPYTAVSGNRYCPAQSFTLSLSPQG